MFASLLTLLANWSFVFTNPVWLVMTAFQLWMLVHAIRSREWLWAVFIFIGWGVSAFLYFIFVYRCRSAQQPLAGKAGRAFTLFFGRHQPRLPEAER